MGQEGPDLDLWTTYMTCQARCRALEGREAGAVVKPFVTLSRQTGAGGVSAGFDLAAFLAEADKRATCPWTVFDKNLIGKVLEENSLPESYARYMPEAKVSEVQSLLEEIMGIHASSLSLLRRINETILRLATMGSAIIVGRAANIVTARLNGGFHARLVAPLEVRIPHVQKYYHLTVREAALFIEREDRGRRDYVRTNFGKNIDDPLLYDLVVNTGRLDHKAVAEVIGRAVLEKAGAPCRMD